ncbi:MAG: hypothetical protein GKR91_01530 [Pseudomonadales bacterium]|nr:hypothetical protein [Pseudomonadales bacterium]
MSSPKLSPLFDPAAFQQSHWQQRPLLLKQLIEFQDPLSADELAGLACEEGIESRLVRGEANWQLQQGPIPESELTQLPPSSWALLVQSVDLLFSEFKALKDLFQFIPSWRLEDVMASFAAPGGGVGPHFDYYDVFLIQGAGQRRWRLGKKCDSSTPVSTESGLLLLKDFEQVED